MKQVWFALGALALFGAGGMAERAAQTVKLSVYKELRAEKFVLVDPDGKKRAELGLDRNGEGNLALYDERGHVIWAARGPGIIPLREH